MSLIDTDPRKYSWASDGLDRALWRSCALGLGAWQLPVGVVVACETPRLRVELVLVHLAVAVVAVVLGRVNRGVGLRAAYFSILLAALSWDLLVAGDALATTTVCMTFLVAVTTFLVMEWQWALPLSWGWAAMGAAASIVGKSGTHAAEAVAVSTVTYSCAAAALMVVLRRFTADVDHQAADAAAQHERFVVARALAREAAEHARTLHDTMINTLCAIASGGAATARPDQVRLRCAEDVAAIGVLFSTDRSAPAGLDGVESGIALDVAWTGLEPAARRAIEATVANERLVALRGVVKELLINVEKHAGTGRATVDVSGDGSSLVVTVSDDGPGLPVHLPAGRGLSASVFLRAAEAGLEVHLAGDDHDGTRAVIRCPAGAAPLLEAQVAGGSDLAERIERRGAWAWCAAVSAASLTTVVCIRASLPAELSAALVCVLGFVSWRSCRGGRLLPRAVAWVVALGVPAGFILGYLGANHADGVPEYWQGIGLAPLLVILLVMAPSRRFVLAASIALLACASAIAITVWSTSVDHAATAIVNALTQLAQLQVWLVFLAVLGHIDNRARADRIDALRSQQDEAIRAAATSTQQRWRDAHVHAAVDLLSAIAPGEVAPTDAHVRQQADYEAHMLRQLLQLSPELTHLGPWLAQALARSRVSGTRVTVRIGEQDMTDADAADAIGRTLLALVDRAAPSSEITIAYFGAIANPSLTVVGPAGFLSDRFAAASQDDTCAVTVIRADHQELVELRARQSLSAL